MDELKKIDSMKKFNNFLKVLSYYHVERCKYEDCNQCLFTINLHYLLVENTVKQNDSVIPLQQFCLLKFNQFKCCSTFIKTLVELERIRILAEKQFHEILELWTKPEARSNVVKNTNASS